MKRIASLLVLLTLILTLFVMSFLYIYQINKTYTIRYYSDINDTNSINLVYKKNEEVHLIVNPYSKDGYRFKGWNINGELFSEYSSYIMPEEDLVVYAEWVKIIHVNLETNNNASLVPLNIDQGTSLDYKDLPIPKKEGYIFEDWYLDSNLTIKYNAGVYKFNNDTSLYAKYVTISESPISNYTSSEKVLINQKANFNVEIYSDIELNAENINSYINVTAVNSDDILNVHITKLDTRIYNLKLQQNLKNNQNYIFSSNNDSVYFLVNENNIKTTYNRLFVSLVNPTTSTQIIKSNVIDLTNNDFYYISNNEVFLKETYVFKNEIKVNEIVKITNNNTVEYAKISKIDIRNITNNNESKNICVLTIDSVSFEEVFETLKLTETKSINLKDYLNKNTISKLKKAFTSSKGISDLQDIYVENIKAYLRNNQDNYNISNNLINNALIDHSKTYLDVNLTSKGFEITALFKVMLSEDIYFDIKLQIIESINVSLNSNLELISDNTNLDIYTKVDSKTTIEMDIAFINKEERINVKDDINAIISNLDIDEFYEKYNEYISYQTGIINLFNINLINIDTTINEFMNINIPINISLNLGINSPIFTKVTINNSKIYGLKCISNNLETYQFDNSSHQSIETSYNGHFNFEKGMSIGLDISFKGFENLGNFGYNIYDGINYDIYGSSNLTIDNDNITSTSGKYFEITKINNENTYYNNPHLNIFHSYISQNDSLLSIGGNEYMVVDFISKTKEIDDIDLINGKANLNDYNIFCLEQFNLKTGKFENIIEDRNTFSVITSAFFDYDKETGILSIKDQYKDEEISGTIIVRYTGNIYNKDKYIVQIINVHYDPSNKIVDNPNPSTHVTLKYMINGELYYEEQVPYNSYHLPNVTVTDDYYISHPNYEYVYWNTLEALSSPLIKDTVLNATIIYKKLIVTYEYELLINNELCKKQERLIATCGVDKVTDLASKLVYFNKNVTANCTFIEWDNEEEVIEYKQNQVFKAKYNKTNLDIVLEIDKVVVNDNVILEKQIINLNIPFGTTPSFSYTTLQGFKLVYNDYNNEKLYTNKLIKAQLIREKDYTIKFYDYYGNVILETEAYFGEDLTNILEKDLIINYKYPISISTNKIAVLTGWTNMDKLRFINTSVELYPVFEIRNQTQKINFILNGAKFNNNYQYIESNGYIVEKGSVISQEMINNLIPIKESTEQYYYVFDGWYHGNTKIDLSSYQITRDITLTARFKELERHYNIEIYANGITSFISDAEINKLEIEGIFENQEVLITDEELSLTDVKKILNNIQTLTSLEYIPTSLNDLYVFDRFIITLEDDTYILVPLYKNNDSSITVVYNYKNDSITNNYQEVYKYNTDEESILLSDLISPQIEQNTQATYYDYDNLEIKETLCAFKTNDYYYVFKGWSLDKENILNTDSIIECGETIEFYAIYEKHSLLKSATFNILNNDEYILVDGIRLNENYILYSNYNNLIANEFVPYALKEQTNKNLYYQYKFIGWYCIESDKIVLNDFNDDYHYIPKFEKVVGK